MLLQKLSLVFLAACGSTERLGAEGDHDGGVRSDRAGPDAEPFRGAADLPPPNPVTFDGPRAVVDVPSTASATVTGDVGFGSALRVLGDVDGDGVRDVFVRVDGQEVYTGDGYWDYGTLNEDALVLSGAALVRSQVDTLLSLRPVTALPADAGDVDGDGRADLWVSLGEVGTTASLVSSADPQTALVTTPVQEGDVVWTVAPDGDGDGLTDVVVVDGAGRVAWYASSSRGQLGRDDARAEVTLPAYARPVASDAGDVDGDGIGDVLLLAWDEPPGSAGVAFVLPADEIGELTPYELDPVAYGSPELPIDQGVAVGDVDGDGFDDVSLSGRLWPGSAHGVSHRPVATVQVTSAAGDVDGDGKDDVFVMAGERASGATYTPLLYGPLEGHVATARSTSLEVLVDTGDLASLAATAADLDGDGVGEVLLSTPGWYRDAEVGPGGSWLGPGTVWLLSGSTL